MGKQRKLCLIAGKKMFAQGVFCFLDIFFHSLQRNPHSRMKALSFPEFFREKVVVSLLLLEDKDLDNLPPFCDHSEN